MKRTLSLLILLTMLLPLSGRAEEVSVSIPSVWGSRSAQLTMDASWFEASPHRYYHGLARLSLAMAVSAFRGSSARPDAAIRSFFSQLHFSESTKVWDARQAGPDTAFTALAWRQMRTVPVIAVAVGPAVGEEWSQVLDLGEQGNHAGLQQGCRRLIQRIRQFEDENGLTGCRYWLSGFGWGGALCQAAAHMLEAEGKAVFCYTFAAPRAALTQESAASSGVFNIVSPTDPLALLPPSSWGFSWYGHALLLPYPQSNTDDSLPFRQFQQVYGQFAGSEAAAWNPALAAMAREAVRQMMAECGSRAYYQSNMRILLYKLFSGKRITVSESLRVISLASSLNKATQKVQGRSPLPPVPPALSLGSFASPALSVLYSQHDPALYASWMLSMVDGNVLLGNTLALTNMP